MFGSHRPINLWLRTDDPLPGGFLRDDACREEGAQNSLDGLARKAGQFLQRLTADRDDAVVDRRHGLAANRREDWNSIRPSQTKSIFRFGRHWSLVAARP